MYIVLKARSRTLLQDDLSDGKPATMGSGNGAEDFSHSNFTEINGRQRICSPAVSPPSRCYISLEWLVLKLRCPELRPISWRGVPDRPRVHLEQAWMSLFAANLTRAPLISTVSLCSFWACTATSLNCSHSASRGDLASSRPSPRTRYHPHKVPRFNTPLKGER